jgi:hypothetical protein
MPEYVIHIGPHKTGTTYLQAAFQTFRPQFLRRGIWYPEQWQGDDKLGHHRLVQRLRARTSDGLGEEFASLNASNHEVILISAEDLSDLKPDAIRYFKGLLADASAHVVFYCRRWSELLPSGWQEHVKHGETITLPEFLAAHVVNPFGTHVINYSRTLDRYAEHFGISNIRLVSYSNLLDVGDDLFIRFCKNLLSWDDPPKPNSERVNTSLNPIDVELLRSLNAMEAAHAGHSSSELFRRYRSKASALDVSIPVAAMKQHTGHTRINEGTGALQLLHTELFKKFGSLLAEPRHGQLLFAPKQAEIPYVRQDYLLASNVVESLHEIYRKIRE